MKKILSVLLGSIMFLAIVFPVSAAAADDFVLSYSNDESYEIYVPTSETINSGENEVFVDIEITEADISNNSVIIVSVASDNYDDGTFNLVNVLDSNDKIPYTIYNNGDIVSNGDNILYSSGPDSTTLTIELSDDTKFGTFVDVLTFTSEIEFLYDDVFANNSWEDIITACQTNAVPDTWEVGDRKTMLINESNIDIVIIGKNHDVYSNDGAIAPLTFQAVEHTDFISYMYDGNTEDKGYKYSNIRINELPYILELMPEEVQNSIRLVDKKTTNVERTGLETTTEKLFLLSYNEVKGESSNGYNEGAQYAYYAMDMADVSISGPGWWLRSPRIDYGYERIGGGLGMTENSMSWALYFAFCF